MAAYSVRIAWDKTSLLESFQSKLDEFEPKLSDSVISLLESYQIEAQEVVPKFSGETANAIEIEVTGTNGSVIPTGEASAFIILGVEPHKIKAIHKAALFWPGAEHPVKEVNNPGTPPNDFMQTAYDNVDPDPILEQFHEWLAE